MSLICLAQRTITCKIVYDGIGFSGKTTNLHSLHRMINPREVGEMVSIDTEAERTLSFDLLPLELGTIQGFRLRFHLYTVPGQHLYRHTRFSVLKGADGVIFVADSQASKLEENRASFQELQQQLRQMKKDPASFPLVMQWNKRDVVDALPVAMLEQALNPFRVPSYEAVAIAGRGVIESLRQGINATVRRLEKL